VVDLEDGDGFVIADIPGLIEGASQGIGLGHEFLRHIERTKVIIHMVDGASVEGRDPLEDILTINRELEAYDPEILNKPQIIAANKMDVAQGDRDHVIAKLKETFEPQGITVMPISAATGSGVRELLFQVRELLRQCPSEVTVYEPEFDPSLRMFAEEPFTVTVEEDGTYVVEGSRIEKMLGYTNIDSEKGFLFFQRFLKEQGILDELEKKGIQEGDTVRMYGLMFDYYK
jgi:GTP-binding protein